MSENLIFLIESGQALQLAQHHIAEVVRVHAQHNLAKKRSEQQPAASA